MPVPDPSFAPPAQTLATAQVLPGPQVTAAPAGGQGFALNPDGTIPASLAGGGTELDYAAITAPVTISHTSEGTADTIVTSNSVTYNGRAVWVHFYAPSFTTSAGTNTFVVLRDSTVLGQASHVGTSGGDPVDVWVRDTPSADAHTYTIAAFVNTSTATVGAGAGGSGNAVAAFVRVVAA